MRTVYALFWGEQQASAAFVALACNFFRLGDATSGCNSADRSWEILLRNLAGGRHNLSLLGTLAVDSEALLLIFCR